ncbi:stimulated by retinoic acid gene 6 protein-like [Haliotis cracherodii]|uniref:stimulated by retinoic acid gene 6 protein-like n=1 Tax=Haliotis cracherodii TaxID=6455 RepID=UPI0039E8A63F
MASIVSNQTIPACAVIIDVWAFQHYINLLAAGMIFILALLHKRRFRPEVCGGRPALIVPLPLLDGYDNRVSYAAAFGAVTNIIANLVLNLDAPNYIHVPLWARTLVLQFRVLEACITCFPLFACISTRHKLAGAVLGVIYSSILLGSTFAKAVQFYCHVSPYSATDPAPTVLRAVSVLTYMPVVLCFFYLIFKFLLTITECIRSSTYVITEPLKRVYTHQQQYVRLVLHRGYNPSKETTTCDKLIYRSMPAFKYPVRIISVVFILLILLYRIELALILNGARIVMARASYSDRLHSNFTFPGTKFILLTPVVVDLLGAMYFITAIVCLIVTSFNIYLFMKSYRRHLLRMFRGNKSFILDQLPKPHIMMVNSMRFPGYQVAYMLWGFSMLFLELFFVGFILTYVIYVIIINNRLTDALTSLLQTLSVPATALLLFYLQVVLVKRVLMQERIKVTDDTPPLSVDNRRFYECFNYYALFGNLAIGLFSCFWRILQGLILGVFMVGRLDHSIYARSWEHRDKGYLSYISMLHVDNALNHPMLRVFCDLLLTALDKDGHQHIFQTPVRRNTKAIRRWFVAYTLINNPELAQRRKSVTNKKSQLSRIPEAELECAVDWPIDGGISSSVEFASSGRNVLVYQASPQDHSDL